MLVSRLSQAIQGDVTRLNDSMLELKLGLETSLTDHQRQEIFRWLSPPDPSSNHNSAHKKQQPTTGAWFLNSSQFAEWRTNSNSFLWLHGTREYTIVSDSTEDLVTDQVSQLGAGKLYCGK